MNINFFKDCVFDLLNESDTLNLVSIESNDQAGTFLVETRDENRFLVTCEVARRIDE